MPLFQLAAIALAIATFPLAVELLLLTVGALLPAKAEQEEDAVPGEFQLAVVIPAHNEELLVGRCVQSVLKRAPAGLEVIVVAHNCSDSTAMEAESAGARVLLLNNPEQAGKGYALKIGFAEALGGGAQAVLVIDADSVTDPGLPALVIRRFLEGAQALQCRYQVHNAEQSQRTRMMALAFQAFNVIRPRGRSRLGLSAGILGNGFALHREVIEKIPYGAYSVVEDLEYHLALVRAGIRVEFVDHGVVWGEIPVSSKGAAGQRARWEGGRMRLTRQLAPGMIKEVAGGQFRLLEPLADLLALPIASEVLLIFVLALLPMGWARIYAAAVLVVLLMHIGAAAYTGAGLWEAAKVVATAPAYILWKLSILPKIWSTSRTNALWVRTEREPRQTESNT